MRTIKFRIPHFNYEGNFSHFSYWGTIDHKGEFSDGGMFTSPTSSSGTKKGWHEQFTGLLDKNGEEIYEGDIVQDTYEASAKGKVVFINGAFRIEYEGGRGGYDISHRLYYKPEVIGNIHENPELTKN